ncbi:4617_t:CDS:2 [Diversispora eburnea]|uniref:4617_t:CDS:1 n=1 Tax=Diversispora eburnea TaxID=1213867 RepID=A0A9N9BH84_9GLOM|nr:4617_t:CDS:2 [Diversispora eburnea]
MKSQTIYSSLLLCILIFTHFLTISAERCVDILDPTNPSDTVIIDCPPTTNNDVYVKHQTSNFFEVTLNCSATAALCNNIKEAFNDAGKEISKVLKLKQIIKVNATFTDFNNAAILGSASSARYIPLTSDDKIIRRYPQALVKQFSLDVHPEYNDYDIIARFNSAQDWWFRTVNETIGSDQFDFYAVILHELIHGLGFSSSWGNYIELADNQNITGLTPNVNFNDDSQFEGFTERIFDKYVKFIPNGVASTSTYYTSQLNESIPIGTSFNNISEFVTQIKSSPQWNYAEFALLSAITNGSLTFTPAKNTSCNDEIYLESSLNPYVQGSSISHVSLIYESTSDFLMKYIFNRGESLEYLVQRGGNYSSPIGPRILSILETIGYETYAYPNPIIPTYEC